MRVLSDVGIDMLHDDACRILADAGCQVDGTRVRFDPDLVAEYVAMVPSEFTLHGRTPHRDLQIGGDMGRQHVGRQCAELRVTRWRPAHR